MDIKTAVFNAARDGKVKLIQKLLCKKSPEELEALAEEKTHGGTPLLIASRYGHLEVVNFLLQHCKVNVELGGSVNFDGETIEGSPPLWAASAAGHLPVVRSLLKHGARVNSTTLTNSTPLRAACFDGHLEIVRYLVDHGADVEVANRHGHTCLMIACYKGHGEIAEFLLERGADVNRRSAKGNTALHDCAESGSLDILKMLLRRGARAVRDGYGMTPLLAASATGHGNVVEYLGERPGCSRAERVDALELLGATYVDKRRDLLGALRYWRLAMELRQPGGGGGGAGALVKRAGAAAVAAYGGAREAETAEELEALAADPDGVRTHALMVRERVLGPAHPDTSYYVRYRGAVYADAGDFPRCVALWRYALDMQQGSLEPLSPMTAGSLLSFAELFAFVLRDGAKGAGPGSRVAFGDLMAVLGRAVREVERAVARPDADPDPAQFAKVLSVILHLLALLEELGGSGGECREEEEEEEEEEERQKRRTVYRLLKLHPRGLSGRTPLHMAVDGETTGVGRYPVGRFPSAAVATLLLECGADPDARDSDNNTPLHVCAGSGRVDLMGALVSAGAHFDTTNARRETARQLLDERLASGEGGGGGGSGPPGHALPPLAHVTLQCLAARAVERNRLPYKGVVPREVEAFIELH